VEISTDKARLDIDLIHAFLSEESYWARGRTREVTERVIAGSLCFGAYADAATQVGFARVVTDGAVFGYLADVFVVEHARGRGVGKALVEAVVGHDDVSSLPRLTLATNDAHRLYEQYGFGALDHAERWMSRRVP
jgi:GNAT superfamily N-acetyltransferase